MEVIATGKLTTYAGSSRYQIIVDRLELAGEGALLKLLEDRRKKLQAEGLFDADRKRPLPPSPRRVAVVTSPAAAAWLCGAAIGSSSGSSAMGPNRLTGSNSTTCARTWAKPRTLPLIDLGP